MEIQVISGEKTIVYTSLHKCCLVFQAPCLETSLALHHGITVQVEPPGRSALLLLVGDASTSEALDAAWSYLTMRILTLEPWPIGDKKLQMCTCVEDVVMVTSQIGGSV